MTLVDQAGFLEPQHRKNIPNVPYGTCNYPAAHLKLGGGIIVYVGEKQEDRDGVLVICYWEVEGHPLIKHGPDFPHPVTRGRLEIINSLGNFCCRKAETITEIICGNGVHSNQCRLCG